MADKAKLLKLAQKHLSKGALDKAIKTFQQLVEVDPKDQRLILRLADIQARAGRKKEAIENYEKIAAGYMRQDFTPKAIAVYKTILRLDPELLSAYEKLAELYKSQGLEAEALSQFENLFQVYESKNDEDRQIEVLKLMAGMDPENLGFQVRLGETLAKKGHKKEAAEAFAKAASTLSRRGFHDRASQLFAKITALNPDNTTVRRELCSHYLESGQFNEARAEIEAILAIEPEDPRMVLLLGRILFQLGNKEEGEAKIAQSIQLFLETGELESVMREFLFVAQSHLRNKEIDEAEAFYRQIQSSVPGEVRAIKGLISVAEARKDRVGQIDNFLLLARTMQQSGDQDGAANAYRKVIELDPLNESAKEFLSGIQSEQTPADLSELQPEEIEEVPDADLSVIEDVQMLEVEETGVENIPAGDAEVGDIPLEDGEEEIEVLEIEDFEEMGVEGVEDALTDVAKGSVGEDQTFQEEMPDIVVEEFEEEHLGLEAVDDLEEGMAAAEVPQGAVVEPGDISVDEMSVDELLAEVDVYERYGLNDKAAESLERARTKAPDDIRVLERIAAYKGQAVDTTPLVEGTLDGETPPVGVEAPEQPLEQDPYAEDLEEADFYRSQGLDDEAVRIYQSILEREPQHAKAKESLAAITSGGGAQEIIEPDIPVEMMVEPPQETPELEGEAESVDAAEEAVVPPAPPVPPLEAQFDAPAQGEIRSKLIVEDSAPEDMGDFLDIADELRSELADEVSMDRGPAETSGPVSFDDIFSQFKRGIEETLGDEEYETHYNLGIAYKDMGLFEDAIREFESGTKDPSLAQDSYSLMAMCYTEQKDYESAVKAVEKAIEVSSTDGRTGLLYQLGEVREKQRKWPEALSAYEQVQAGDPAFEGISEAIERVKASLSDPGTEIQEDLSADTDTGMDDMLTDLIREVEEMARESSGESLDDPGKPKKDRISYL